MYFLFITFFFSSLLHCKNTVYNTHTEYVLIDYVISKASSWLLVVKFWRSQKLYLDFRLHKGSTHLTPISFKGQMYIVRFNSYEIIEQAELICGENN